MSAEKIDPADKTPAGDGARDFLGRHGGQWEFSLDGRTGHPVLVQGSGIPMIPGRGNSLAANVLAGLPMPGGEVTVDTLEPLARGFIEDNASLLLPARGTLELDRTSSAIRRDGALASIYFNWKIDGVPVEGAAVFVRLNSGNLVQFGAPLVGPVSTSTQPALDAQKAIEIR